MHYSEYNISGTSKYYLRGHRNQYAISESSKGLNEGNLRELIRFQIECENQKLNKHFEAPGLRNKYNSPVLQNGIIECCGNEILQSIVNRVKLSKYYSSIFDDWRNYSMHISQMSLVVRYVSCEGQVSEDFLGFIDCNYEDTSIEPTLTENVLAETLKSFLKKVGQNLMSISNAIKCPCNNRSL